MAEHKNVELVRRGYEAFQKGDMDTLREIMAADVVWHTPGNSVISGDKKGIDATLAYFGKLFEETDGTVGVEIHDIVGNDEHVVGLQRDTGQRKGKSIDQNVVLVFHVEGGQAKEVFEVPTDMKAYDDFWK
jgi:ketosteroid isomerase-like protein